MPNEKPPRSGPGGATSLGMLTSLLGYHLRRAQVSAFQNFAEVVGPSELTPGQFGVLVVVDANPGLSQTQLGNALGIDRSTVVAVIDRLESRGLLTREPSPNDRRSHALHLSHDGAEALTRLGERVRAHERTIARDLTGDEQATLIALLRKLARDESAVSDAVTLRAYRENDLDALIDLFRTTVRTVARRDYTEAQVRAWAPDHIDRARWARRLADSETIVAEISGTFAGFANLSDDGLVDLLFVHADRQRCGVAAALLRRLEAYARSLALPRLHTEASLTARPFFERHGFRVLATQTVTLRGETLTNFRMEKVLA